MTSATSHTMVSNGTHFNLERPLDEYNEGTLYYQVEARDSSDNIGTSSAVSIEIPKPANGFTILSLMLSILVTASVLRLKKKKKNGN